MKTWYCHLFRSTSLFIDRLGNFGVMALNYKLGNHFHSLWEGAALRIAADGGGNRIYDFYNQAPTLLPHIVKGDFDSLRGDVLDYYMQRGVVLTKDGDQNSTDMQKCLSLFASTPYDSFSRPILVCGGMGGNLTHTMANIESAVLYGGLKQQIYLLSDDNIGIVLEKGKHTIHGHSGMFCGFIPLSNQCKVTSSSSLKYPLDGLQLSFGSLVSSSNEFTGDSITIDIPERILFLADARKE